MKATSLWVAVGAIALGTQVGCAQSLAEGGALEDVRGSIQVAHQTRLVVAGPAADVHTSVNGDSPVSLFLVNVVHGDDRDCAAAPIVKPAPSMASSRRALPKGRELCAAATGSTEVIWHAHNDTSPKTLALQ